MFESVEVLGARLAASAPPGPDRADPLWVFTDPVLDPDGSLVDQLVLLERVKSAAEARSMMIMAELCGRAEGWVRPARAPRDRDDLDARHLAAAEVAPALRLAPVTAGIRIDRATRIVARLPGTLRAFAGGLIDTGRVRAIYDATEFLTAADAAKVETVVLPGAPEQTAGELRAALRTAVIAVDPDAAETRRKEAVKGRSVRRYARPDGMSAIEAVLSAIDTGEIHDLVDDIARGSKTSGDTRSMDARRADALVFLLLGRDPHLGPQDQPDTHEPPDSEGSHETPPDDRPAPSDHDEPAHPYDPHDDAGEPADESEGSAVPDGEHNPAGLAAPADVDERAVADTAHDHDEVPWPVEPADLDDRFPPEGPPVRETGRHVSELLARCMAALCARRAPAPPWVDFTTIDGPDGPVTVAHLHGEGPITAQSGRHLLGTGAARPPPDLAAAAAALTPAQMLEHDPRPALAEAIRARDGTCRHPGCRRTAHRCDTDHTIRFPDGLTIPENLSALCRRHHRVKHEGGWTLQQTHNATLIWTTRLGRSYATHPRGPDGTTRGTTNLNPPASETRHARAA